MKSISDAKHPIWPIIRLGVMLTALVGALYVNATKFDATELKTILIVAFVAGSGEGLPAILNMFSKKEPK